MKCRLCQHADLSTMISWPQFPIYIWPIQKEFEQEYHALNVYHCADCGLVQLDIFEEDFVRKLYSKEVFGLTPTAEFPTTLKKNSRFLQYCSGVLGDRWSEGKNILDVGGYDVLNAFDLKYAHGVICDPNAPDTYLRENLSICKNFFSREWFDKESFDFVIAKHIIEHINDLAKFMDDVGYVLKEGATLILETPELSSNLKEGCYALFYHQHLMYFDAFSLENVVRKFGFTVIDKTIDNGNLRLVARKLGEKTSKKISYEKDPVMPDKLRNYQAALTRYLKQTELFLKESCREARCICYGAGGATTLLFHHNPCLKGLMECVVDSSVNKIGKKIGGTSFIIQDPAVLADLFDRNIIINSIEYFDEISRVLHERYEEHNFCHLRITPTLEKLKSSHTIRK